MQLGAGDMSVQRDMVCATHQTGLAPLLNSIYRLSIVRSIYLSRRLFLSCLLVSCRSKEEGGERGVASPYGFVRSVDVGPRPDQHLTHLHVAFVS